jgi:hypothetical protein
MAKSIADTWNIEAKVVVAAECRQLLGVLALIHPPPGVGTVFRTARLTVPADPEYSAVRNLTSGTRERVAHACGTQRRRRNSVMSDNRMIEAIVKISAKEGSL